MKKLFLLIVFCSFLSAETDWSDSNDCELPNHSNFVNEMISKMSLEQKIGQIIMPDIQYVTPDEAKKYQLGSVLNGGGSWPNNKKTSTVADWQNLSKAYYLSLIHI